MIVVVLGRRGFLGRAIDSALGAAGMEVRDLELGAGRFDLVRAPMAELVARLARAAPDAIVNAAGAIAGEPDALFAGNLLLVQRLVDGVALAGGGAPVLVHLGSAAEYVEVPAPDRIDEATPRRAPGLYGQIKAAATDLVARADAAGVVRAIVLRPFNPIGPGMRATNVIGRLEALIRAGAPGPLPFGPLGAARDYLDVRDVADAVVAAVRHRHRPGGAYAELNVCTGVAVPTRDVIDGLVARLPRPIAITEAGAGSERSGGIPWQCGDPTRAAAVLGWKTQHALGSALDSIAQSWGTP